MAYFLTLSKTPVLIIIFNFWHTSLVFKNLGRNCKEEIWGIIGMSFSFFFFFPLLSSNHFLYYNVLLQVYTRQNSSVIYLTYIQFIICHLYPIRQVKEMICFYISWTIREVNYILSAHWPLSNISLQNELYFLEANKWPV